MILPYRPYLISQKPCYKQVYRPLLFYFRPLFASMFGFLFSLGVFGAFLTVFGIVGCGLK